MQQGNGNKEAFRIVGVASRPGRRWLNGRGGKDGLKAAPPISSVVPPSGLSRSLTEDERIHIADPLQGKVTIRQIVAELGRIPSTTCREVRATAPCCTTTIAGTTARMPPSGGPKLEGPAPKVRKIIWNPELRDAVQEMLVERWSPRQICRVLRISFPGRPEMRVVPETVCQALYVQGRSQLGREPAGALCSGLVRCGRVGMPTAAARASPHQCS
ncbi:hypothetical protein LRE75_22610 [Streptomyces sp. 372A]